MRLRQERKEHEEEKNDKIVKKTVTYENVIILRQYCFLLQNIKIYKKGIVVAVDAVVVSVFPFSVITKTSMANFILEHKTFFFGRCFFINFFCWNVFISYFFASSL